MVEDDLKCLKSGLELVNGNEGGTTFISYGTIEHHVNLKRIFAAAGYSDHHQAFVYNDTRGVDCYIYACEILSVMYRGGRRNCTLAFSDPNPRARHNVLFAKANHKRLQHVESQEKVNLTEKPSTTTFQFCQVHACPGGNVLILGGGAGGDAEGALLAGMNVFVVERDPIQFNAMIGRFTSLANQWEAAEKKHQNAMLMLNSIGPTLQSCE